MASSIKLDVGGIIFKTSRLTLTKYDCMFRAMLENGIPLETDESGCIFIDRDPTHFRYILNFLRDGKVELPENPKEIKEILAEAEFYSIQDLIDHCKSLESDYRFVKDSEEIKKIVLDAKRDILVLYYPERLKNEDSVIHQIVIKDLVKQFKNHMDIYFKVDSTIDKWEFEFHIFDDALLPKISKFMDDYKDEPTSRGFFIFLRAYLERHVQIFRDNGAELHELRTNGFIGCKRKRKNEVNDGIITFS